MRRMSLNCWAAVTDFGLSLSRMPSWTMEGLSISSEGCQACGGQAATGPAAVDGEDDAADVARSLGHEVRDRVGDLVRLADPVQRDPVEVALSLESRPAGDHRLLHLGLDRPGSDAVDPDAVGAPLHGERADQPVDAGLGGAVRRARREALRRARSRRASPCCRRRARNGRATCAPTKTPRRLTPRTRSQLVERVADGLARRDHAGVEDHRPPVRRRAGGLGARAVDDRGVARRRRRRRRGRRRARRRRR